MLTYTELATLERSLRDRRVLSVYLDGTAENFAEQRAWRVRLRQSLRDLRAWLTDSPHAEREEFERCVTLLDDLLEPLSNGVGSRGWAAFITADSVHMAEHLPVAMPTMAVWSSGASIAPYVRALKQSRPVVVAIADSVAVTLYRYERGALSRMEAIEAEVATTPPLHMGDSPRVGFHTGVRGSTGRDDNQRVMREATKRMLEKASEHAVRHAGTDGWILTGGIPAVSSHLARSISLAAPGRSLDLESLDIHASEAEITAAAERGASTLRDFSDLRRVGEMITDAGGTGLAALGLPETMAALDRSQVRELYFTPVFVGAHGADAESAVRSALSQGAIVEELSRTVAGELDAHGGIAARLRYRLPKPDVDVAELAVRTG